MHVHVFPSFPSLIFLSKKKGIGAHFFHMTQGFLTWCYPKPFFCSGASEMLQDCEREVALSASREGNPVLWLPKVSRGGSPLPRAGREIPRSMVTVIFTTSEHACAVLPVLPGEDQCPGRAWTGKSMGRNQTCPSGAGPSEQRQIPAEL